MEATIHEMWIVNKNTAINGNHIFYEQESLLHPRLVHLVIHRYCTSVFPDVPDMSTKVVDWIFTFELHRILRINSFVKRNAKFSNLNHWSIYCWFSVTPLHYYIRKVIKTLNSLLGEENSKCQNTMDNHYIGLGAETKANDCLNQTTLNTLELLNLYQSLFPRNDLTLSLCLFSGTLLQHY